MQYSDLTQKQKALMLDLENAAEVGLSLTVVMRLVPEDEYIELGFIRALVERDGIVYKNQDFKFDEE